MARIEDIAMASVWNRTVAWVREMAKARTRAVAKIGQG